MVTVLLLIAIFADVLTATTYGGMEERNVMPEEKPVEIPRALTTKQRQIYLKRYEKLLYQEEQERSFYDKLEKVAVYLKENGYVAEKVTDPEIRYTIELALNLSTGFASIPEALILSVIANESGFDKQCTSGAGAKGLCQIIPRYHATRLQSYLSEDEVYDETMFYSQRLSILTCMDYLTEILNETEGDLVYALMWYNQGPLSAYDDYICWGLESDYALDVIELMVQLEELLCQNP